MDFSQIINTGYEVIFVAFSAILFQNIRFKSKISLNLLAKILF